MRGSLVWKKGEFSWRGWTDELHPVKGYVSQRWGIDKRNGEWVLNHLKIGYSAGHYQTLKAAQAAAIPMDKLAGRCKTATGARRKGRAGKAIMKRFGGVKP